MPTKSHGLSNTPEYVAWADMKRRCYDTAFKHYKDYGGRGITVCDTWRESFVAFLADMGIRPGPAYTLDRIDNMGNYEPGNCRWATRREQAGNRRHRRCSKMLTFEGETFDMKEWASRTGIPYTAIQQRIRRGWSVERTLTESHHAEFVTKRPA